MSEFGIAISDPIQFELAVIQLSLHAVDLIVLVRDVMVQLVASLSLRVDLMVQNLQSLFLIVLVDTKFVVMIVERSDITTLLRTFGLNSFNFFIQEGESLSQLFDFMSFNVGVFASFVGVETLLTQQSFSSLHLIIQSTVLTHLLINLVSQHT